jgi:hypothetical protein
MYAKYVVSTYTILINLKSICIWLRHGHFDWPFFFVYSFRLDDQLTPSKNYHFSQMY